MKAQRKPRPCVIDTFTLPLFPGHVPPTIAQSVIETIRRACHIDKDGHWIWAGKVRYYGAPCMTYQRVTRPVRQVLYALMQSEHKPGMPLLPRCGNPLCVAPSCIMPKRNADLMSEGRRRRCTHDEQPVANYGLWGQLIAGGGR